MKPCRKQVRCEFNLYPLYEGHMIIHNVLPYDLLHIKVKVTFTVVKQLKQLQRKPRKKPEASTGFLLRLPVEASDFFLGFLCNCLHVSCFITVRITYTSIFYPQFLVVCHSHNWEKLADHSRLVGWPTVADHGQPWMVCWPTVTDCEWPWTVSWPTMADHEWSA